MCEYLPLIFTEMTQAKGHRKEGGEEDIEVYKEEINWRMNNFTVKSFVICNPGHLFLSVHIDKYEIFVVRANIERREMDAELQLRPEVNGHIDDLGIV